jgi:predicted DNA-binding transcriptional regulator YafY
MSGMANIVQLILRLDSMDTLINSKELASELDVSERQIRNYIQILREQGIEVEGDQAGGGGYSGRKMRIKIPWRIREKEYHALRTAINRLENDDLFREMADLKSLNYKLGSQFKYAYRDQQITYRDRVVGLHKQDEYELIQKIDSAIRKQKKVKVIYKSSNSKTVKERVIHPYALEGYNHAMYMKGFCEDAEDYRTFKLNRIEEFTQLEEMYEYQKSIEAKIIQEGFGIFRQEKYRLIADFYYPFNDYIQEVHLGDGQEIILIDTGTTRINVTLDNVNEIVAFLLGFGSKVKVIEPKFIKDMIIAEARKILEQE